MYIEEEDIDKRCEDDDMEDGDVEDVDGVVKMIIEGQWPAFISHFCLQI